MSRDFVLEKLVSREGRARGHGAPPPHLQPAVWPVTTPCTPLDLSFLMCRILFLPKSMVSVRLGSVTGNPQILAAQTTEVCVLLALCPSSLP